MVDFALRSTHPTNAVGWVERQRLGKNAWAGRASFEASLREAPQDEPFSSISSMIYPHAEERPSVTRARLEARTTPDAGHSCPTSPAKPIGSRGLQVPQHHRESQVPMRAVDV